MDGMTAELDDLLERFRADLEFAIERLGVRPTAKRLGVSTNSIYHWRRDAHEARLSLMRAVLKLAEDLRSEGA